MVKDMWDIMCYDNENMSTMVNAGVCHAVMGHCTHCLDIGDRENALPGYDKESLTDEQSCVLDIYGHINQEGFYSEADHEELACGKVGTMSSKNVRAWSEKKNWKDQRSAHPPSVSTMQWRVCVLGKLLNLPKAYRIYTVRRAIAMEEEELWRAKLRHNPRTPNDCLWEMVACGMGGIVQELSCPQSVLKLGWKKPSAQTSSSLSSMKACVREYVDAIKKQKWGGQPD